MTGQWIPTAIDIAAGRLPGYGLITNIINGGIECGRGPNPMAADRIGFYKHYCDILDVGNLNYYNQRLFGSG
jgi:chitinase